MWTRVMQHTIRRIASFKRNAGVDRRAGADRGLDVELSVDDRQSLAHAFDAEGTARAIGRRHADVEAASVVFHDDLQHRSWAFDDDADGAGALRVLDDIHEGFLDDAIDDRADRVRKIVEPALDAAEVHRDAVERAPFADVALERRREPERVDGKRAQLPGNAMQHFPGFLDVLA